MEIEEKIAEAMALANIAMDTDPDNEECNDDDSDQVAENVVFDAAFLEEAHIAATIIQCMVRRDQAMMFVDILWEQTAAALSLQSVMRGHAVRTKTDKSAILAKNRFDGQSEAEANSRALSLETLLHTGGTNRRERDFRHSSLIQDAGRSVKKEDARREAQNNQTVAPILLEQTTTSVSASYLYEDSCAGKATPNNSKSFYAGGTDATPTDNTHPQSMQTTPRFMPQSNIPPFLKTLKGPSKSCAHSSGEGLDAATKARQQRTKQQWLQFPLPFPPRPNDDNDDEFRAAPGRLKVKNTNKQQLPAEVVSISHVGHGQVSPVERRSRIATAPSRARQSISPGKYAEVGQRAVAGQCEHITERSERGRSSSPMRDRLFVSGAGRLAKESYRSVSRGRAATPSLENDAQETVAQAVAGGSGRGSIVGHATEALRSASCERGRTRLSQNDALDVVAPGALIRAAESFGNSLHGASSGRKTSTINENDAATTVLPGMAAHILQKIETGDRGDMAPSIRSENDSSRVVTLGSHARCHGHFEVAAQQAKCEARTSTATSDMTSPGTVALVNGGFLMIGGNLERPMRKPFKHGLSGNSVAPMLSMGSQKMPGMARCSGVGTFTSGDGITAGAASGKSVWPGSTMVTGGSVHTPGMAKATERSSNTVGVAAGRSVHHGGTFVTTGSLDAPDGGARAADTAKKKISPEILGAASGKSAWEGGTLLTNGSVNTPGMARTAISGTIGHRPSQKNDGGLSKSNSNASASSPLPPGSLEIHSASVGGAITRGAAAGKSVDKGLSLFAMGSMLSEANAEVGRHQQQFSDSEARFRHVPSTDLPLWSLGSKLSIAAVEEERQNYVQQRLKGAGGGAAFGNTFGAAAAAGVVQNSAIPMLSLGSTTAPGMRGSERATTLGNTYGIVSVPSSSSFSLWPKNSTATLLNFGSAGAPGMARNTAFHTSGNLLGAVAASSYSNTTTTTTTTTSNSGSGVGLLMMGSAGTSGMARDSQRVPGVWSNTDGAVAGMPLKTSIVNKTTGGNKASLVLDQTTNEGFDYANGRNASKKGLFGNTFGAAAAGKSVDMSGGGTMLTSGSHGAMERSCSAGVIAGQGGGRSITHGADATGKPVFTGITFGTGGSSGLRIAEHAAKRPHMPSTRRFWSRPRPMHSWQKMNEDDYATSSVSPMPSLPPITTRSALVVDNKGHFAATTHRAEVETVREVRAAAEVRHRTNTRESSALNQSLIRGGAGLNSPDGKLATTTPGPIVEGRERSVGLVKVKPAAAWAYRMAYLSSPEGGNTRQVGSQSAEGDNDGSPTLKKVPRLVGNLTAAQRAFAGQRAVDRAIARAATAATTSKVTSARTYALSHVAGITKIEMAAARLIADGKMVGMKMTTAAQLPDHPPSSPQQQQQQLDLAVSAAVLRAKAAAMRAQVSSEAAFGGLVGNTKHQHLYPRRT